MLVRHIGPSMAMAQSVSFFKCPLHELWGKLLIVENGCSCDISKTVRPLEISLRDQCNLVYDKTFRQIQLD